MSRWGRGARLLLCAIVAAAFYLPYLGSPALWEPDEGRYAEVPREMVLSGDWVTPRDDFVRYFEKPPLVYWMSAVAIEVFGAHEFAIRLPAALFTIGEVVVVEALAEAMFGPAVGLLAAVALALSPLFFGLGRFATLDPALAFFIMAGLGCFYFAARAPDFGRGAGRRWMVGAAAMLALGTLVKGPVALALGGLIAFIFLLVERRGREIARIPWLWCAIVYVAIVAPWFALAESRNPGMLRFFFIHENVHRFLANTEHGWGPWFFVPITIAGTWPWFYFAPLGALELNRAAHRESAPGARSPGAAWRLLLIWFVVIFVFFSIPRSKLGTYILPALPPLAIVIGYGLGRLRELEAARLARVLGWFAGLNALILVAAAVSLALVARRLSPALVRDGIAIAALIFAGALAAWLAGRGGRRAAIGGAIAAGTLLAMVVAMHARHDAATRVSYRRLARAIEPYLRPGCTLASYRHFEQSLPFYTGRRETLVDYRGELAEPFDRDPGAKATYIDSDSALKERWASGACVVVIVNRRAAAALKERLGQPAAAVLGCEGKKVALYNGRVSRAGSAPRCESGGG